MKRAIAHAALLLVLLPVALVTWIGADNARTDELTVRVWNYDPRDVASVTYRSPSRTIELQRRGSGADAHIWGIQTDSVREAAPDTAVAFNRRQVTEFPASETVDGLFETLARLRATRELSAATDSTRVLYGIADTAGVVTVRMRGGTERSLALGNNVLGGVSRYVLDREQNRLYVLPPGVVNPLEGGADVLRLTKLQDFEESAIATVTVRAATGTLTMRRRAASADVVPHWTAADSDRYDAAFAAFMDQVSTLWVTRYVPNAVADTLQPIVRIDYQDRDGDALGFLELFRTRSDTSAYLLRTRRTVVLGEVYAPVAERIEQDARTILRSPPR